MTAGGGNTYEFTLAASADEVSPKLMQGELDIACVPANLASVLYNRTDGGIVTLAVNTLGVLYIVENGNSVQSMADLAGRTIVASGKGSTPEYALRYLLTENGIDPDTGVTIDWKSEHSECVASLASGAAAEVIGLPAGSIGEALYTAKVYFQTGDLFAWTAVIVTVSVIFERLFLRLVDAAVRKAGS